MKYVDIASRFGDVTLRVTPVPHPWDTAATRPAYDVQITAPTLDASSVAIEDDEAAQTLIEFCRGLAEDHKGFDYDRHWESLGGDLKLRADHDQINAIRLYVTLSGGVVPRWTAYAEMHVDPGRFDRVAINLGVFGDELINGEVEDPNAEPERIDPRQRAREPLKRIGTPNPQASG